ncbi:FAD-binding oxidoreductase [Spirillospora sp. CA-294931]|uniref:FAD-binding oxidoreductase n=1 Tax=Spirillospora sp. CA-294931 TaxID=3240042 RepID=UPI003D8A9F1D
MRPLDALAKVCADVRPGEPEEGVLGVAPGVVASPATVAEAAETMRTGAGLGLAVVPRGGETRLDWGMPPDRCDLLLDTSRLDRIVEHASGDLIVTAGAGLAMDRLAEALAEHGQRLSLDVPLPGSTVGGTIATGAAGPLRLLYGSPRDLVIGLTVVRADGAVARSGGKVVKNVAGYDLGRLFCGSFGTLGVIVEATFRLHPVPSAHAYVTCATPDVGAATQAVLHSPVAPSAIECSASDPEVLTVLLEGTPEGVAARSEQVAALLGPDATIGASAPEGWGLYPDGTTLIEVAAPPTVLAGLGLARWSPSGRGYVGLDTSKDDVARELERLRREAHAIVCYAPEDVRAGLDLWGPVPALPLMKRVKDQFDPDHRLSPGRFVGGI